MLFRLKVVKFCTGGLQKARVFVAMTLLRSLEKEEEEPRYYLVAILKSLCPSPVFQYWVHDVQATATLHILEGFSWLQSYICVVEPLTEEMKQTLNDARANHFDNKNLIYDSKFRQSRATKTPSNMSKTDSADCCKNDERLYKYDLGARPIAPYR